MKSTKLIAPVIITVILMLFACTCCHKNCISPGAVGPYGRFSVQLSGKNSRDKER